MEHQPSLLPNFTMFIQMGLFLASWGVLHFLVIRPYSKLFHRRHEATDGLRERAQLARERAVNIKTEYEQYMKEEHKKITAWIESEKRKISDEQLRMTQKARNEVAELLLKTQSDIKADLEKAKKELLPKVSDYSSQIVKKLIGDKIKLSPLVSEEKHSKTAPVVAG